MVWTPRHLELSHRSSRERQRQADLEALPLIRSMRARGCSFRMIADELEAEGIQPPGAAALNSYEADRSAWHPQKVKRIWDRYKLQHLARAADR